ncbi:MAG: nucleoside triphosphate pyrophosphohydrolase [Candidatus Aenigmarchaeota archaeon]|nr:nucleoside triphosphate pyrophosphohydrolase [Candidatus Aenigmarchaeota archaeon]
MKLVRDKIPEIMKEKGKHPTIHVAEDGEYWQMLKEKLKEEAEEFWGNENVEELADILEVIHAICEFNGTEMQKIEEMRKKKTQKRGSFKKRIILDETK